MHNYLAYIFFLIGFVSYAYADNPEEDSTQVLLLENIDIQLEATQAINDMYNFHFEKAERQFRWIKQKYPHLSSEYL